LHARGTGSPLLDFFLIMLFIPPPSRFGMERVYELERYSVSRGAFGSSKEFLDAGDKGKWADEKDGLFWTLDEASRTLPAGWAADPYVGGFGLGLVAAGV